jgi:2-oxoglutarate ferredoxin oxidoreductase subunit gamma
VKVGVIAAGHGGQGVLELANNLAYFHLLKGNHVAYTPSYGPESRGGKVKCYIVASDMEIDSPIVEEPDFLIVMNIPSMDYVPMLKSGGTLIVNSSLVSSPPVRSDIRVAKVPATEIASGLKEYGPEGGKDTSIAANSVMLGAYLALTGQHLDEELGVVSDAFSHFLTDQKAVYIRLNVEAVKAGYSYARGKVSDLASPPVVAPA